MKPMTWMEAWQACQKLGFTLNRTNSGKYLINQQDARSLKGLSLLVSNLEDAVATARSLRDGIEAEAERLYNEVSPDVERAFDAMRKKGGPIVPAWEIGDPYSIAEWVRPSTYAFN